ncbi:MAG: hypothetical protein IKS07_06975 [Lachnospiraceae bacterium]|nr:hypothetical protein [Lachnospiraceae bacterium]
MLKMSRSQKKMIGWFAAAICLAVFFTSSNSYDRYIFYDLHTFLYAGVVIAWGFLVHQRIVNRRARRYLVMVSAFMLVLFLSRLLRWRCFRDNAFAQEYALYAYYASFLAVPLCAFLAALCIGKTEKDKALRAAGWLWLVEIGFTVILFTNGWHQLFFRFEDETHKAYSYGIAFYACIAWILVFVLAALIVIVRRCQLAAVRKYWVIPVVGMLFFLSLSVWYYANGGNSPTIHGIKLYMIHEVFCFLFIFPFESMIEIGILPSNSRYGLFFRNSPVHAEILDEEGTVIYASKTKPSATDGKEQAGDFASSKALREREQSIHGGRVVWQEDLGAVRRLEKEIRKVTEDLEQENELIREESSVRSELIRYETRNRLYDRIAGAVREKALVIEELLSDPEILKPQGKEKLIRAMVIGAYVKRMGNLILISEEKKEISVEELASAVRESLEYAALTGAATDFQLLGERSLPAKTLMLAYNLLETVLERADLTSLLVVMDCRDGFLFRILTEAPGCPVESSWRENEQAAAGTLLETEYVDDAWRLTLRFTGEDPGGKEGLP